jgi:hypothetical protein
MFWSKLGYGVAAGAAGVTALNAITYLDMAVRARPPSGTPAQAVEQLAQKAGAPIPAKATTAPTAWTAWDPWPAS